MVLKEILAVIFLLTLFIHGCWCLFVAYPLLLDKQIKKGMSWIYLPLRWKGLAKQAVSIVTPVLLLSLILLSISVLWLFTQHQPRYYFYLNTAALIIIILFLHSYLLKIRLRQQEDSYFYIRGKISRKMDSQGKNASETETNNLASFQHQNLLREADEKGNLLKELKEQSRLARKDRKTRKSKWQQHHSSKNTCWD